MKEKQTVSDIHSYSVFANIDDREGKIKGFMMYLSKEQYEAIEDIILSGNIIVKEECSYEVED